MKKEAITAMFRKNKAICVRKYTNLKTQIPGGRMKQTSPVQPHRDHGASQTAGSRTNGSA